MSKEIIGIGEYLIEDYEAILKISEDRDSLDETWIEWKINKEHVKKQLTLRGLSVIEIIVKPDELLAYCKRNNFKVNGKSRAIFIQEKVISTEKEIKN